MSNTEQQTEQEIQNKGLNAPRLTPEHIGSVIVSEHYFTAAQGDAKATEDGAFVNGSLNGAAIRPVPKALELLTFCVLVLKNGFTVTGESACASPENFDAEIGRKVAYENAREKIWILEGYLLKEQLHIKKEWQEAYRREQLAGIDRKIGLADIGEDPVADVDTLQGGSLGSVGCASGNNVWIQQENTSVLLAIASSPVFSRCIRKKAEDKLSKWLDQID